MKQFAKLNAVLGLDALESVDEAVSMNEEQLELVERALLQNDQAIADARTEAETQRDDANASLATAQTSLANAVAAFDEIDPTIATAESPEAKAEAVRTLLAAKPGVKIEGILDTNDPAGKTSTETDWEAINNLPHNKEVDENS